MVTLAIYDDVIGYPIGILNVVATVAAILDPFFQSRSCPSCGSVSDDSLLGLVTCIKLISFYAIILDELLDFNSFK